MEDNPWKNAGQVKAVAFFDAVSIVLLMRVIILEVYLYVKLFYFSHV